MTSRAGELAEAGAFARGALVRMQEIKHRVFLVDDQAMIGEAVRRMLADQTDIAFEFCRDANAAADAATAFGPTVILQDLVMEIGRAHV